MPRCPIYLSWPHRLPTCTNSETRTEHLIHVLCAPPFDRALKKCVDKIHKIIEVGIDCPDGQNELKRMQLRELAALNGTLREDEMVAKCKNCGSFDHRTWQCPMEVNFVNQMACSRCGGKGHIAADCRVDLVAQPPAEGQSREKMDSEYMALMSELGEGGPPPPPAGGLPPAGGPPSGVPPPSSGSAPPPWASRASGGGGVGGGAPPSSSGSGQYGPPGGRGGGGGGGVRIRVLCVMTSCNALVVIQSLMLLLHSLAIALSLPPSPSTAAVIVAPMEAHLAVAAVGTEAHLAVATAVLRAVAVAVMVVATVEVGAVTVAAVDTLVGVVTAAAAVVEEVRHHGRHLHSLVLHHLLAPHHLLELRHRGNKLSNPRSLLEHRRLRRDTSRAHFVEVPSSTV